MRSRMEDYSDRSKSVLIFEDDAETRVMLKKALEGNGFEVKVASDGIDCMRSVRHSTPDPILLDVAMPRMDGLGVLQSLQKMKGYQKIHVILVTAMGDSKTVGSALGLGINDYLVKPFSLSVLKQRVVEHLFSMKMSCVLGILRNIDKGSVPESISQEFASLIEADWSLHQVDIAGAEIVVMKHRDFESQNLINVSRGDAKKYFRVYLHVKDKWCCVWPARRLEKYEDLNEASQILEDLEQHFRDE